MNRTFLFLAVLILTACTPPTNETALTYIRYFQDPKTQICFATASTELRHQNATLAAVPCTNKVLAIINAGNPTK